MENQTVITTDTAAAATRYVKERDYWLENLSGELTAGYFPYDKREPQKRQMETFSFSITGELFARLTKISTGKDLRLHVVLTAAVVLLLYRYTQHPDILVGTPIYRQESTGDFINTVLTLRTTINEGGTLKELLLSLRETLARAVENQNYPLDALLYLLNMKVSGNRFPLFDCAVLLESLHDISYLDNIPINTIFSFSKNETDITGTLHYNGYLYEEAGIRRIAGHFKILLREVSFNLDSAVSEVNMVSHEEKNLLVKEWNKTNRDYPPDKTIHGLFEEQARKNPGDIALICEDGTYTYSQLDDESSALAGVLTDKGVKAGDITGIKIKPGSAMAVALLAILKAGAAYLPIDPRLPEDRSRYILKDAGVSFIVTADIFDNLKETNVPFAPVTAGHAAYIIYTSGSTGRPRGVVVEHGSAVNTLLSRREDYKLGPGDCALQLFSFSFDGFVTGFFTPLISGAALVIPDEEQVKDISRLKEIISRYRVTHFISVPVLYQGIIENLSVEEAASLKTVTLAGDNAYGQLMEESRKKNKHLEVAVEYGVTEAAVMSTIARNQQESDDIVIGKPTANTRVYILNKHKRLQGTGVAGELCIGGAGVSRGYLNNPGLTAEKFAMHPDYGRIYRSGDLARRLPDGNIQFLGRIDFQVKIRGNRIEPGEIETRLAGHGQIRETVVTAVDNRLGHETYLCAYFVSDTEIPVSRLREYLALQLPDYMIPAYFVRLEEMPYTHTGKIDRKQLPDAGEFLSTGNTYIAPRNPNEENIVKIWSGALKLEEEKIGIDDSFFEIGGNSINVLKVQNKINQVFNLELSMSSMFLYPTIRELAEHIFSPSQPGEPGSECMIKLNHGGNGKNLFIIHPKHGMIYQYKELARLLEDRYNIFGIQAAGLVSDTPLPQTMEEMFLDYKAQIKAVQSEGPYLIAGYCLGAVLAYEIAREFEDEGSEIEQLIIFDMQAFLPDSHIRKLRAREFASKMVLKVPFISSNREKSNAEIGDIHSPELPKNHSLSIDTKKRKKAVEQNNQILPGTYRPRRIINSPVLLFKAEETKHPRLTLKHWQKLTRGDVTFIQIPGNHDIIFETPYVEEAARILKSKLKEK
ncbi:MAG: amino acid adenylation domain-containing protein [bacterium]|nr:amino acid adenylation domain-containing protein [bacterium]